jgi:protease I
MKSSRKLFLTGFVAIVMIFCFGIFVETVAAKADLSGKHIAILIGEGFQDEEAYIPMGYMVNLGAKVTVVGVKPTTHKAYNSDITVKVHKSVSDVSPEDFDALIIPGGHSPGWLRQHEEVVKFARKFFETGKPTAAICHGPQVLITAGVLEGRKATCFPGVSEEIKGAGVEYHDVPVLRDGNLITSRIPDDIPLFCKMIAEALQE